MHCPRCFVDDGRQSRTEVRETRPERSNERSLGVRRRRQCTICGHRFTTIERPKAATVRTGDGKTEAFDEERLFRSLQRSTAGAGLEDREIREVAEQVRRAVEGHRGSMTPGNLALLSLEELGRKRTHARALYRERTPSLADEDDTAIGLVKKRLPQNGPVFRRDEQRFEPFDRRKLLTSLRLIVHCRVKEDAIVQLIDTIERRVAKAEGPISTKAIRSWVADGLRPLDPFAYLQVLATAPDADLNALRRSAGEIQHGLVWRRAVGEFEQFSRGKLIARIKRATASRNAISDSDIENFAAEVGQRVRARVEPVESGQIGQWVLAWLRQRDPVAFISLHLDLQPPDSPGDLVQALRDDRIG